MGAGGGWCRVVPCRPPPGPLWGGRAATVVPPGGPFNRLMSESSRCKGTLIAPRGLCGRPFSQRFCYPEGRPLRFAAPAPLPRYHAAMAAVRDPARARHALETQLETIA